MTPSLQNLLQDTIELSQELLLHARLDGTIVEISPAWTGLLGWSESDLRGTSFTDLVHPDDLESLRAALARAVESPTVHAVDARVRAKEGSYRRFAWKALGRGNGLHAAGHEVAAGRQEARVLTHDLNNLLQNIISALELIRKLSASGRYDEVERFMVKAIASAHRAAELNQQLASGKSYRPEAPAAEGSAAFRAP